MIRTAAALAACIVIAAGCAGEQAEGRPWVRAVRFVGVKSLSARRLARRLQVEQTNWLGRPKRYLEPFAVDLDRQRIEAYYHAHGFFDTRVTAAEVKPVRGDPDQPTAVDVTFTVDEGLPTKIETVQLQGLDAIEDKAQLSRDFTRALEPGARLDHQKYLDARQALESALPHLGYAFAEVHGRVVVNRRQYTAKIVVEVSPGACAHFSHVYIDGLERGAERPVVRHTGIRRGDPFTPDALDDAQGRLYNLGLFSAVRVDYQRDEQDPAAADVRIHVREGKLNDLDLGVGAELEAQRSDVHVALTYARYNWLGGLRTLRLHLEPAWVTIPEFWRVDRMGPALISEATLIQPDWPCRRCVLAVVPGFDIGIDYAYQYYGPRGTLALTRGFWRDRVQLGASYNLQFLEFFNTDPSILLDPAQAGRLFGYTNPYRLGWWQQDFALDLRDEPLATHRGGYFGVGFEEGGPYAGGAFRYEKITPDVRAYAPLGRRLTLAGRVVFGQLFSHGDLGSPTTRRYYLGGPSSHRGFNYDRLSRQIPSGRPGTAAVPIGGDQMFLAQLELRLDVVRLFGQWLSVAGFVDAGDVGAPNCGASCGALVHPGGGVDWGDLNYAAGGGARYRTLVGTVRFDLGVRLNRLAAFEPDGTPNADPGQRFAFHISLGEAF